MDFTPTPFFCKPMIPSLTDLQLIAASSICILSNVKSTRSLDTCKLSYVAFAADIFSRIELFYNECHRLDQFTTTVKEMNQL